MYTIGTQTFAIFTFGLDHTVKIYDHCNTVRVHARQRLRKLNSFTNTMQGVYTTAKISCSTIYRIS